MLYSCLREATKVKTLTDLDCQILSSQNVPVLVERFINFVFEHGLESKGKLISAMNMKRILILVIQAFIGRRDRKQKSSSYSASFSKIHLTTH